MNKDESIHYKKIEFVHY